MLLFTLAQAVPSASDPLGGWGSLLLQGGAFALLCIIVLWLYPRESEKAQKERERRDKMFSDLIATMQDKFAERNKELALATRETAQANEKANDKVVAAVHEQTGSLSNALRDSADEIKAAVAGACHALPGSAAPRARKDQA